MMLLVAALLSASADTHTHYHMGVRAYAGTRHAAMLHHVASLGGVERDLALGNAKEMQRLAAELHTFLARLRKNAAEAPQIAAELDTMSKAIDEAAAQAKKLQRNIAEAKGRFELPGARSWMQQEARKLFASFQAILAAHKAAEAKLGIQPAPDL